jgi:hypothetical protein
MRTLKWLAFTVAMLAALAVVAFLAPRPSGAEVGPARVETTTEVVADTEWTDEEW